jgi:hexosaminidase
MKNFIKPISFLTTFLLSSVTHCTYAAQPFFTIIPITAGTQAQAQSLVSGLTSTYTITNTSGKNLMGIHLDTRTLPAGNIVTQDTSNPSDCAATFSLANGASCTLSLLVTGVVDQSTQTYGTPGICYGTTNACSQPTKANRLYVTPAATSALVAIDSVSVGPMAGDSAASEFSMKIQLTNGATQLHNWQLGFYMPRSFAQLLPNTNPRLTMQICSASDATNCVPLVLQQAASVRAVDESAGSTTILAPQTSFSLSPNEQYTITLAHDNQWNAGNYSAYPQSFFLVNAGLVSHIATTSSTYSLPSYDASATAQTIATHISTNWTASNTEASALHIVPSPVSFTAGTGTFTLQNGLVIHNALNSDNTVADFLATDLLADLTITASVDNNSSATTGIIISSITDAATIANNPEGYQIVIGNSVAHIYASNNTGVFYALQTLRQLWNQSANLPAGTIIDYPRFKYRGVLLDTARHFFSVDDIETLIDLAATHKLNTLHIHFADDEGFRIGLDDYNAMITAGANTRGYGNGITGLMLIQSNLDITTPSPTVPYPYADTVYTGTYSETDLTNLVAYANARSITIIPEIDLPGHARALIKAFPAVLVDPNDRSKFISVQGYNDDVLPVCTYNTNVSVGSVFTTLINDILTKTANLFANQSTLYKENEISVGGDEVSGNAWINDSSCTGAWSSLSALEKSHKFFQLLAAQLTSSDSSLKISGWQQYIQTDGVDLGSNVVPATEAGHVWVWNTSIPGIPQAINLAQNNYPVVLAFADQNYFDLAYTPDITEPGFTWAGAFLDTQSALSSALSASSVLAGLTTTQQENVVGIEGTLWSENLASKEHMIYMALPKMAGLAEAGWSNSAATTANNQPDWQDLASRLGCGQTGFLAYLNKLYSVKYRGYPNGIKLEVPTSVCPS